MNFSVIFVFQLTCQTIRVYFPGGRYSHLLKPSHGILQFLSFDWFTGHKYGRCKHKREQLGAQILQFFGCCLCFNKAITPLVLVEYEIIMVNSVLWGLTGYLLSHVQHALVE